jgi:hypothetical protein
MDYNESIRQDKKDRSNLIQRIEKLKKKGKITKIEEAYNEGLEDAIKIVGYEE